MSNISFPKATRVLHNRNYLLLVLANIVNRFGDSVDSIVFTWLTYSLTGSASFSALIYAANRLPTVLLQPITGVLMERRKKQPVMVATDLMRAALVGYILLRLYTGVPTPAELLAFTLLISTVEAFRQPAGGSILPYVVEPADYTQAVSYQSGCSSAAELAGLGAGAVIIGLFGNTGAMLIDVITFLLSAVLLGSMGLKESVSTGKESFSPKTILHELGDGVNVIRESHAMRYLVLLALLLNALLVPFNSLQAAMTREILHGSEEILSLVGITISLGMIAGSMAYPTIEKKLPKSMLLSAGSLLMGAMYLGTVAIGAWIPSRIGIFAAEGVLMFLVGMGIATINTFANVSIIQKCDRNYLSRLNGLLGSATVAAMPVVSLMVSLLTGFVPVGMFFIISGVLVVLLCGIMFREKSMPKEFTQNDAPALNLSRRKTV